MKCNCFEGLERFNVYYEGGFEVEYSSRCSNCKIVYGTSAYGTWLDNEDAPDIDELEEENDKISTPSINTMKEIIKLHNKLEH